MKCKIQKHTINIDNLYIFISILDVKTHLVYLHILFNTKYQIIYLSNNIITIPYVFSLYLFSKKKNIINTIYKNIKNKILFFYFQYKLSIEFIGIGYKLLLHNNFLYFILGYSHLIKIKLFNTCEMYIKKNNNKILLHLIHSNKYMLGNIFYIIKSCRKLNIYKGKGIKNIFDILKLKLGKTKNMKK